MSEHLATSSRNARATSSERRMMLGMSQQKLADAFGLTFQQAQKYEKG
jgi:transcriptional regulator with XRE-family HTH domain